MLLAHIIGDASGFSSGGPGKGMHNRSNRALSRYPFLDTISSIHHTFTDSGLFGLNITGASSHSADLMSVAIHELQRLSQDITDEEFERCVMQLRMMVMMQLENEDARVEEAARSVSFVLNFRSLLLAELISVSRWLSSPALRKRS